MRSSEKSTWFRLVTNNNHPRLEYDGRLYEVLKNLENPHTQSPSLVIFMGRQMKDRALRQIFKQKFSTCGQHIHLHIDSRRKSYPLLFAHCDPHAYYLPEESTSPLLRSISWSTYNDKSLRDIFLTRLIFLFTDVLFLFADDLGGIEGVKTLLTSWATLGSASSLSPRPGVVIVTTSGKVGLSEDDLNIRMLADLMKHTGVAETFSSIDILCLPPGQPLQTLTAVPISDEMFKCLDLMRRYREEHCSLFSANDFNSLFDEAINIRCRSQHLEFDFIRVYQKRNGLSKSYWKHLSTFFSLTKKLGTAIQNSLIASSMFMQAYPPNSHLFEPHTVFQTIYKEPCIAALPTTNDSDNYDRCRDIETCFVKFFRNSVKDKSSSYQVHISNLHRFRRWLSNIRTEAVCLCCLSRFPQHSTSCHSVCDVCVELFGEPVQDKELQYKLHHCLICKSPEILLVDIVPRTATIRGLALDGGGVRGVLELQKLLQMEGLVEFPIQWLFDVISGTSIGGIIEFDLVSLGITPAESLESSIGLLKQVFQKSPKSIWSSLNYLSLPSRLIRCWVRDGLYGPLNVDSVLQHRYGTRSLFGRAAFSSIRFMVTTVTVADVLVLITNYKIEEHVQTNNGYLYLDPRRNSPSLWQCARATSAAPGFFPPIDLPGIGDCQDGALKCPNPAALCRSEAPRIWPWEPELGVLLSLGTGVGMSSPQTSPLRDSTSSLTERAKNKFPFRLFRSLMSSMDGTAAWLALMSQLDKETREYCFRLDTLIPGGEPPLDSVKSVEDLIQLAYDQGIGAIGHKALKALLAASFYIRFVEAPRRENTYFRCLVVIRCRFDSVTAGLRAIAKLYGSHVELILGGERVEFPTSENAACYFCRRYCLPVHFTVRDLSEPLRPAIGAEGVPEEQFVRLGPPRSASWYCERQGISRTFEPRSTLTSRSRQTQATDCVACVRKISQGNPRKHELLLPQINSNKKFRLLTFQQ